MPQIKIIPVQHWNFKAVPDEIDVSRILKEAEDAGDITVVRIEAKFASGKIPYLFVLQKTSDYAAVEKDLAVLGGLRLRYSVTGFQTVGAVGDNCAQWGYLEGKDKVNAALQKILKNRALLYKPQRVTVACI